MESVNGLTIVDADEVDHNAWSDFVWQHTDGNIFQTPLMYKVYSHTPGYKPVFFALQKGKKIKGVLLGVIISPVVKLGWITSYSMVTGGPLVEDADLEFAEILLDVYSRAIRGKVLFSQFRNLSDMGWLHKSFSVRKYEGEPHLNYLVNLKQELSDIWGGFSPTCKNKINKATKSGLEIRSFSSEEEIESAYYILSEVYGRIKYPLVHKRLFLEAMTQLNGSENVQFMGAYLEGKMIAMRMLLVYKDIWYDWYAGSFRKYTSYAPNEMLTWQIMKRAKECGAAVFDFGGAGNPNIPYGVRDYKRKFGGEQVDFGRYERVYHPKLFGVLKKVMQRF